MEQPAAAAEPFPLWMGDTQFALMLNSIIGHPHAHPECYHPEALPIRRLSGVYGSAGAQKRRVLSAYCFSIGCPKLVVRVRSAMPADLEAARAEIDQYLQPQTSPYGVDAVIIINHAHFFQRDPHALTWRTKAENANVVIVALFDTIPAENPEFRSLFHKASLYLRPPETSALRVSQMRWHLNHYLRECGGAVRVEITDDEWTQLSDEFTARASPRQLKHYVQVLLYHVLQTGEALTYAMATRPPFVSSMGGEGTHIVPRPLNTEENAFAAAAGVGPIHTVPPIQPPPPPLRSFKKQKVEAEIDAALKEKGEEEEAIKLE